MRKTATPILSDNMVINSSKLEKLLTTWISKEAKRNEESDDLNLKINSGSKLTEYHKILEYIRKHSITLDK